MLLINNLSLILLLLNDLILIVLLKDFNLIKLLAPPDLSLIIAVESWMTSFWLYIWKSNDLKFVYIFILKFNYLCWKLNDLVFNIDNEKSSIIWFWLCCWIIWYRLSLLKVNCAVESWMIFNIDIESWIIWFCWSVWK